MKINLRPLKGDQFQVEVEATQIVADLKKRIAELKPEFSVDAQKLIFAGKILVDDTAIGDVGLKETDFIVVMATKTKAAVKAAAAPAVPAVTPAAVPETAGATPAATPAATAATPPQAVEGTNSGGVSESAVAQLCEMGFPRDQVVACLRAAFNNADRAVEYLMTGIPERERSRSPRRDQGHADHAHGGHGADAHTDQGGHSGHGDSGHGGHDGHGHDCSRDHGQGDGDGHSQGHGHGHGNADDTTISASSAAALQQIRNHPRFSELAAVVQENPTMLPTILQSLAATNPEIMQAISENQEAFLQMLGGAEIEFEDGGHADDEHGGDGTVTVEVSESDRAAVERLAGLGFSPDAALEAYLACDRKEELAANYLFDNMGG